MADVAAWAADLRDSHNLYVRWTWTRGVKAKEFRVTAQAYDVVDGQVSVKATVYDVWPSRTAKTVEALMMNLIIKLEHEVGAGHLIGPGPGA